ncbi:MULTISPECIES: CapA family protein [Bacillaceae]|uniref:CapA family protein n=1 Tax=Evansella alkalicola TaxID=745819 RepID=A0ABS6K0V5_9BACI|nr:MULTISPECIES: CapA family protein [Bacillaceae]MBU9723087.1 CapA family protein [Bacillus alkalicola]
MVKVFICGDIVNYQKNDGLICSGSLAKVVAEADYSICNFEAPIEGFGEPQPKSGPHHYQKKSTINGLKEQGFNLLCMANNHIMDFGTVGLMGTINEAKKLGMETIGAGVNFEQAYKPIIKSIGDIKLGIINACEAQFGVIDYFSGLEQSGYAWINHSFIDKQIIKLKKECDFVIVLAHAGLEHYNIPQKEWRWRYKHFCDLGADAIIGSHPHVPQGFENYNDSLIFYSLGNFYFDSKNFINKEDRSYSIVLRLEKNKKMNFEPVFHHKEQGIVQLSMQEKQIDFKILNSNLDNDYEKLHDQMSLTVYRKKIKPKYTFSLLHFPFDGTIKSSLKRILATIVGKQKKKDKDTLALHLLRNESYYFAAKHALELVFKDKYGGNK